MFGARVHETRTGRGERKNVDKVNCEFPNVVYPIKVFSPHEMDKVIAEKNNIRISQQCYDEMSDNGKQTIKNYNSLFY